MGVCLSFQILKRDLVLAIKENLQLLSQNQKAKDELKTLTEAVQR